MSEHTIMHRIMLAVSRAGTVIWRNNVGTAWAGQATVARRPMQVMLQPGDAVVRQARPLHAGLCKGSSDLVGLTPVVVAQRHVGTTLGVFTAIEVKSGTKATEEQKNFIRHVLKLGGLAGVARDETQAAEIISRLV